MRPFRITGAFRRDVRRDQRRGKDIEKMWSVVDAISRGVTLPARHRAHKLAGNWADHWECHIEPDWLLVWREADDALELVRLGTHADLFD